MRNRYLFTFLLYSIFFTSFSQQKPLHEKYKNGIINLTSRDSTWSLKMFGRVQLRSEINAYLNDEQDSFDLNFLIRRARLKFSGEVLSSKLSYKLELGLSNNDISGSSLLTGSSPRYILDAFVNWRLNKNFRLIFGQTKLPGNRERIVSSGRLQFVDRSILNRYFNIDRDIGFILKHFHTIGNFLIKEGFAISKGEGRNVISENLGGLQYTGKLEFLPLGEFRNKGDYFGSDLERENNPKLSLAIAFNYNDNAVKSRGNMGSLFSANDNFIEADVQTFFADAIFKYKGFSCMIEYAKRTGSIQNENSDFSNLNGNQTLLTGELIDKGDAINIQAGKLLSNNLEVSLRYTRAHLIENFNNFFKSQYTLGVSKYIIGHDLKLQSDISYNSIDNRKQDVMFRIQLEIGL